MFAPSFYFLHGHTRPLVHLFLSFKTNITTHRTNKCEKCPSSIWCWDSNPWLSGHESPPITTEPELPPFLFYILWRKIFYVPEDRTQETLIKVALESVPLTTRPENTHRGVVVVVVEGSMFGRDWSYAIFSRILIVWKYLGSNQNAWKFRRVIFTL